MLVLEIIDSAAKGGVIGGGVARGFSDSQFAGVKWENCMCCVHKN